MCALARGALTAMAGAPPILLLLLLGALCAPPARAGSHSLRYFHSTLSRGLPGAPPFSVVGYVDDAEIAAYSSESRRYVPRAPWMEGVADPQYWDRGTEILRGSEAVLRGNVRTVMGRYNQTAGLHVFQWMYGCELRDDGSSGGFWQHGYDGRDFVSFDKENLRFTAATDTATATADTWNEDEITAQRRKAYLERTCIEWLQKYLNYGKERLLRRVPPQALISRGKTGAATTLTCYAYGFYPREIQLKWMRNEVEVDWKTKTILPNTDGTYQIRSTVELPEGHDVKDYRCLVDHISLEEIITVVYEEKSGTLYIWLIGGAIAVALVALGVAAAVIWKRKHPAQEPDHRGSNAEAAAPGGQRSSLSGHPPVSAQSTGV